MHTNSSAIVVISTLQALHSFSRLIFNAFVKRFSFCIMSIGNNMGEKLILVVSYFNVEMSIMFLTAFEMS